MTRINLVPPSELSDKHLGAEYRELPRVFGLVRDAIARGERPDDPRNPKTYVLGPGHVRFFYNKCRFLHTRYMRITEECRRRGRIVNYSLPPSSGIDDEWWGNYEPTPEALALNRQRIKERS